MREFNSYRKVVIDCIILLPLVWAFAVQFLYADAKKHMVFAFIFSFLVVIFNDGFQCVAENIKNRKSAWLLGLFFVLSIIFYFLNGYSSNVVRASAIVFFYFTILPKRTLKIFADNVHYFLFLGAISIGFFSYYQGSVMSLGRHWEMNPIPLSTIAAVLLVSSLAVFFEAESKKKKIMMITSFIFSSNALVLGESRGVMLAMGVAVVLLVCYVLTKNANKIRMRKYISIFILSIVGLLTLNISSIVARYEATKKEVASIESGNLNTSIGFRLQLWHAGAELIKDKPILGYGESHKEEKERLAKEGYISKQAAKHSHYHNQYIDSMVKNGVGGLFSILLLIFLPLLFVWKK
ncbi:O-antigen ligase family protein [Grimontia sp. S25]|uniref:O-antigen ligase family protein n=1 Tax=Grimontia sedimenti TaxID=2711294 RepID=A0A6M1RMQ2_9GAMM|nr:O-antigen ligase family protein [Grimontia sedimenti]